MNCFTNNDTLKIKGVAILFMIFHHLFRLASFSNGYNVNFFPFNIEFIAQLGTFFKICVPIFAFLSGYGLLCIYKKNTNYKNFVVKRYFKIISTFMLTAILSYIYVIIVSNVFRETFFNKNILNGLINIIINVLGFSDILHSPIFCTEWWYISTSIVYIILLPLLYKFSKKYSWTVGIILLIILPRLLNLSTSTISPTPFLFSFYLGMLFQDKDLFNKILNIKIFSTKNVFMKLFYFICFSVLCYFSYLLYNNGDRTILWEIYFGIIPITLIIYIHIYINNVPIINKILYYLGKYSFIMYLIHSIIIVYNKESLYLNQHFLVIFLKVVLLSYVISFILQFILNKINYYKLFDNISNIIIHTKKTSN